MEWTENGYDTSSEFSLPFHGSQIQKLNLLNKEKNLKYFSHGKVLLVKILTNSDILMELTLYINMGELSFGKQYYLIYLCNQLQN